MAAFLGHSPPYFLRQGLSLNLKLTGWPGWPPSELKGPTCPCSPALSHRHQLPHVAFYVGSRDLNLSPSACMEGSLANWAVSSASCVPFLRENTWCKRHCDSSPVEWNAKKQESRGCTCLVRAETVSNMEDLSIVPEGMILLQIVLCLPVSKGLKEIRVVILSHRYTSVLLSD